MCFRSVLVLILVLVLAMVMVGKLECGRRQLMANNNGGKVRYGRMSGDVRM